MKDFIEAPRSVTWGDTTYATLVSTAESGGVLSLIEVTTDQPGGPPRHVHAREDETFVVLSGEVEFWLDGQASVKGPGEAVFIPRGAQHTYRPRTAARFLVILTPGGFEGFFAEMAAAQCRIPEDMPLVMESAARHHLAFTGPPL